MVRVPRGPGKALFPSVRAAAGAWLWRVGSTQPSVLWGLTAPSFVPVPVLGAAVPSLLLPCSHTGSCPEDRAPGCVRSFFCKARQVQ